MSASHKQINEIIFDLALIMSVKTKAKGCPFLETTKKWFTDHFQEDWNEDLWKSIGLADLVKEGRDSFIGRIVSVLLQAKLNFNWDLIVRYAGELFELLMKEPEKGGDNKLVKFETQFSIEYKVLKKVLQANDVLLFLSYSCLISVLELFITQ
jgi:hypothetical protein